MTIIHPEITVTPDCPTVQFRAPRETVDLDDELRKVLHRQGWTLGTYFHVQFVDHDRNRLLATAPFVVSEEAEEYVTGEMNLYQTMSKTVFRRHCKQAGPWVELDVTKYAIIESDFVAATADAITIPQLQKRMKALTGKGFPPGTSRDDMVKAVADAEKAA